MSRLHLELHILFLCSIVLAHQSFGGRVHQINQEEIADVSPEILSVEAKASSPQDMNPSLNSSHTVSSIHVHLPYPFPPQYGAETYFASYMTQERDSGYFGVIATMDVYGYDLKEGQMSSGSIYITNFEGQNNDQIVVGWMVSPPRYNDSKTHLSTGWVKDGAHNSICGDLDCPGLQLVSGSPIFPSDIISPVTEGNGARQTITIKVLKDKSSGDWWLHCGVNGDPIPIGYYPASLFDRLSMKATHIILGGVVSRSATGIPPMGSGAFPSDSDEAAVIRDIQLIDQDGTSTPIGDDMPAQITDFRIYSVSPMVGSKFSYGGPRKWE